MILRALFVLFVVTFGTSIVHASDMELIQVSVTTQQAVLKTSDNKMILVQVGQKISDNLIVSGLGADTIFLKNISKESITVLQLRSDTVETIKEQYQSPK